MIDVSHLLKHKLRKMITKSNDFVIAETKKIVEIETILKQKVKLRRSMNEDVKVLYIGLISEQNIKRMINYY